MKGATMDENTQAHRLKVQRGWLIYMGIITGLYAIFGAISIIFWAGVSEPYSYYIGLFVGNMMLYGIFAVWLNYILVASAVGYSIYCYIKDRQHKMFFSTLLLAALNIVGSIGVQLFSGMAIRQ